MKTIKLKSRYGKFTVLAKKSKNTWRVTKTAGCFSRFGGMDLDDVNSYRFFDPEGGPFLSIGDDIEGVGCISKIYHKKVGKKNQLLIDVE